MNTYSMMDAVNPFDIHVEEPDDERLTLLGRLVNASRNVRGISPLGDAQLYDAAKDWHEALISVPTNALTFLRLKGVQSKPALSTASDFLNLWNVLEAQRLAALAQQKAAEQNEQWSAKEEAERQSPPQDTPDRIAFRLQRERHLRGQLAIVCDCDDDRVPRVAKVNDDMTAWICRKGECEFCLPLSETKAHESRAVAGPLRKVLANVMNGRVSEMREQSEDEPPKRPRVPEFDRLQRDAKACNLSLERSTPQECANFSIFSKWFYDKYEGPMSSEDFEMLWPVWSEEHQQKLEALEAKRNQQK